MTIVEDYTCCALSSGNLISSSFTQNPDLATFADFEILNLLRFFFAHSYKDRKEIVTIICGYFLIENN